MPHFAPWHSRLPLALRCHLWAECSSRWPLRAVDPKPAGDGAAEGQDMTRLLIIGPPGSGKGTQAEHIARHFGVPTVSTGEIFRTNVSEETPLGLEASRYLDDGAFAIELDQLRRQVHAVGRA